MNSEKIHFLLDLAIHESKFEDFEATVKVMADDTGKEPGALEYEFYLSDDRTRCRLLEIYSDVEAMQKHLASPVVKELVPKLLASATIDRFEVYGTPDLESAAALTSLGGQIFRHWRGIRPQQSSTSAAR